ncbi:Dynein heavy chain domain-containing protein 1 [Saguinus oedipus]|uniref:Dynein heavy chain domain-containing protein 1 n=1 Tax=Saguinus oedipus TaxID=9490 RepID=A0ABQ9UVF8_SAGOE|nr:Dynein heavy chain domain-containing protein 1 [Saguinus oedipus]
MDGTVYAHSTLELQMLQPTINYLATVTVPGYCERPLCPRLFRLFTVLALESMTQATLLSRHVPIIQAWLERFPSVEQETALARALVRASVEAWEAVCNCFMPSPLHPHYHFSLHSVSHLLSSLQLLPNRTGSRGFVDYPNLQEHLRRVTGLRGTRLTAMMATRNMVRLWLHEAQRTFCDRLDSPGERSFCAQLLLGVAQSVFCCRPGPQHLGKDHEEDEEDEEEKENEKPSDLVFSQELILGSNSENPNLYLERQWEKLEEQLATSAAQLKLSPHLARVQNALENLRMLIMEHSTHADLLFDLEQQLKASFKDYHPVPHNCRAMAYVVSTTVVFIVSHNLELQGLDLCSQSLSMFQQQLEQSKLLYKQQLEECRHQEKLIKNLAKQRDALQAQQAAFLEQMSKAFLEPLSQLQVADFEEIRSYRAPPESVVQVTNALCDLFHRETGWASAKQLLCTEDFYQELVFFPKEKMTDSELIKLHLTLMAPGMNDAALRAVSLPAASLAAWLWAVLHYGLARCRGLPTGLLLQQVEATLTWEQARLGYYQFQAQETLEHNLALTKMVEDAQDSHNCVAKTLSQAQYGQHHKWPMMAALRTPIHTWTTQLQKLKGHCMTVFGDTLLCSAAIIYLGPFPPLRRQELLDKWLALCGGFQEALGPDDVAQALKQKQKSVSMPPKNPLLATRSPFSILSLLSSESEQHQWDQNLKPEAKSARLAGLLLRSPTHYRSCRWPLLLDPSNQALMWLDPLPEEENRCLAPAPAEGRGKGLLRNQNTESKTDMKEKADDSEENNEAKDQTKEQKAEERKNEQEKEPEEKEEKEEEETESQGSKPASATQLPSLPYLSVLSGADPELGSQLREAAAHGLPVLLTNVELGLGCQELQWLLQREQLSPPQVQPGFCLYLSTTLSLCALEKGCELLKGLNVLDLGLNMEILEEQMLHEILCRECPELETHWQDLKIRALDARKAVETAEVLGGSVCGLR